MQNKRIFMISLPQQHFVSFLGSGHRFSRLSDTILSRAKAAWRNIPQQVNWSMPFLSWSHNWFPWETKKKKKQEENDFAFSLRELHVMIFHICEATFLETFHLFISKVQKPVVKNTFTKSPTLDNTKHQNSFINAHSQCFQITHTAQLCKKQNKRKTCS